MLTSKMQYYHTVSPNARTKQIAVYPIRLCSLPNADAPEVFVGCDITLVLVPPKMSSVDEPEVVTTTGVPLIVTTCPILAVTLPPMTTSGFPEMVVGTALNTVVGLLDVDTTRTTVFDVPALATTDPMTLVEGDAVPVPEKTISVTEPEVTTWPTCPPTVTLWPTVAVTPPTTTAGCPFTVVATALPPLLPGAGVWIAIV